MAVTIFDAFVVVALNAVADIAGASLKPAAHDASISP